MRSTTGVYGERNPPIPIPVPEPRADTHQRSASAGSSMETRVPNDPYARYDAKLDYGVFNKHSDVDNEEGWISIPCSISSLHLSFSCLFSILLMLSFGY